MKCTVLGGGGFIGSSLVDRLLAEGHRVKVLVSSKRQPYRTFSSQEPVEWLIGDFSDQKLIEEAVKNSEVVFHLICTTLPKSSHEEMAYDITSNLVGSIQLFQSARALGVQKIVFISSGGTVYGRPNYLPIDEAHPTNPIVSYGITKLAIEKYLLLYAQLYGLKAVILRASNVYGERQREEREQGAVGVFLRRALAGEEIEIWGDGTTTRDYVHVSDMATAFIRAMTYNGPHQLFNVSTNIGTSLNELIVLIEEIIGRPVKVGQRDRRVFDVPANVLDNSLIKRELEWQPRIDLRTGITRTIEWYKEQRKAT